MLLDSIFEKLVDQALENNEVGPGEEEKREEEREEERELYVHCEGEADYHQVQAYYRELMVDYLEV